MKGFRSFYKEKLPFYASLPIEIVDLLLRGSGQVVLMNNSITGLFIIIGLFYANWWIAFCGCFGLILSTLTAFIFGFNFDAIRDGLHGYNGFLVGLALATFTESKNYLILFPIILTSSMSSVS